MMGVVNGAQLYARGQREPYPGKGEDITWGREHPDQVTMTHHMGKRTEPPAYMPGQ